MSANLNKLKERLAREIDLLKNEMVDMARRIYEKPEIGYKEYEASRILMDFLKRHDFHVSRNIAGMDTAFLASCQGDSNGPTVAILAEYDALPGLGHGCGHHLIGAASAGAAAGLSKILSGMKGRVVVVGCPAEEAGVDGSGGKVRLVEKGYFDGIDAAFIFHPTPLTTVGGETSALVGVEFEFIGKAAHAAGNPWDGINALDGVLQTFNAINALRQHVKDNVRIHGIVTHGGDAPNIVPERAAARFFIRSTDRNSLEETARRVWNCARGASIATGTKLKARRFSNLYDSMKSNSVLAGVLEENLKLLGLKVEGKKKGKGSTDFGNVTRAVPACELAIRLGDGIVPHTKEFLSISNSEEGYRVMMLGAKVMSMSAVDLLKTPRLLEKAKKEFKSVK